MSDVTRILSAIEQGDAHAAEQLLPLVYDVPSDRDSTRSAIVLQGRGDEHQLLAEICASD